MKRFFRLSPMSSMVDSSSSRHILIRANLLGMIGLSMMIGVNQNSQKRVGKV